MSRFTVAKLIKYLSSEGARPEAPITFFSSPSEEWGLLSIYMANGNVVFDIQKK